MGFDYLWNNGDITRLQLNKMIERLHDQFIQGWFSDLNNTSKLASYKIYKSIFELEKYIYCVSNNKYRVVLSRFRCASHKLNIEVGRHKNIERHERLCTRCNMLALEDEYHFALVCPFYRELRNEYLPRYYCVWPNIQKFKNLLSSKQSGLINKLAKFLYLANQKRESV